MDYRNRHQFGIYSVDHVDNSQNQSRIIFEPFVGLKVFDLNYFIERIEDNFQAIKWNETKYLYKELQMEATLSLSHKYV